METAPGPVATRQRVLNTALDLFCAHGYHRTSMQSIADRVGITKAAVHYHFPRKVDILLFLLEPVWRDFETMISNAEEQPQPRWPVIEGYLDLMLKHRAVFQMAHHDPSLISHDGSYARVISLGLRMVALVTGPDPDLSTKVRAAQLVSMLGDPIVMLPEVPIAVLRKEILAGARRLFDDGEPLPAPAAVARSHGGSRRRTPKRLSRVGRPGVLTGEARQRARQMHASGVRAEDIAAALDVSRATIYRYLH